MVRTGLLSLLLVSLLSIFSISAVAQTPIPTPIRTVTTLPTVCRGGSASLPTDVVFLISGGIGTLYQCTSTNAWTQVGSGYGVNANAFPGADPCVKMQAAIYSLANIGGIVNATGFTSVSACSVNPFQAPNQSNPVVFTGIPQTGLLLLPPLIFPTDVPWFVPNKWTVSGIGGYGTNKTSIQPSGLFQTNRPAISHVGGSSGCSATNGSTVVISGTTITNPQNLNGMFIQCSSNTSATAVPTLQNSQVGGIVAAVSGTGAGPYTLTLAGSGGAAGNVTNTGWTINPVIGGWQPNSLVFGSTLNQLSFTCTTPSTGNVTGCIGFLDLTGNEGAILSNLTIAHFDYLGLGLFTAQSQNGGPFGPISLNFPTGNNATVGIELGGTGWNSGGGGITGLCGTSNPCSGLSERGFFGITLTGAGTGANDGGIAFDANSGNVRIRDSHCESVITCVLIGAAAAVQGFKVDGITGCSSSSCAVTSMVDISSAYAATPSPGPIQNIQLSNIAREFGTTWAVRDFINLVGISEPTTNYSLGSSGSAGRQIFTSAQQMSCITSLGVLDTNGAHCAPSSQIPIISKIAGNFFCDSWNNNGTVDVGKQINNCMQWAFTQGITNGAIFDATGFNRTSGYPMATSPWSSGAGTYPSSGTIRFGFATFYLSQQYAQPVNWTTQCIGGEGLGGSGSTGTLFAPNVSNTLTSANYGNDTTTGSVSVTAGGYTLTGSGTNFTSANLNHMLLACAALPCTTGTMVAGKIVTVVSTTSVTLDVPAQGTLSGAQYTITAPLVDNKGIVDSCGFDGNSYSTGGLIGIHQDGGQGSYFNNLSFNHFNLGGVNVGGLQNGLLTRTQITVATNSLPVFMGIAAMQGSSIQDVKLNQAPGVTTPLQSYGIIAAGQGTDISDVLLNIVNIGIEAAITSSSATNNFNVRNIVSGTGAATVKTLIDIGGINFTANNAAFDIDISGLTCAACTAIVADHLNAWPTLTDTTLSKYSLGRANVSSCRTFVTTSITDSVPSIISCGSSQFGSGGTGSVQSGIYYYTPNVSLTWGNGVPSSGTCTTVNGGSIYLRLNGTPTTTLYTCDGSTGVWTVH